MGYSSKFFSVVDAGNLFGTLTVNVSGIGKSPANFNASVLLQQGWAESDIADALRDAINAAATTAGMAYSGTPWFSQLDQTYANAAPLTFLATSLEHVVNVWSQQQFKISVVNPVPEGMIVNASGMPTYSTVAGMDDLYASGMFTNSKYSTMDSSQKARAMQAASSMVASMAGGFPLIQSQFLFEYRSYFTDGFHLDWYPVQNYDGFYMVAPISIFDAMVLPLSQVVEYLIEKDGNCTFKSILMSGAAVYDFLRKDNVLKMRYEAGLDYIPDALVEEVAQMMNYIRMPLGVETMKAGTSMMRNFKYDDYKKALVSRLQGFFNVT